MASLTTTQTAQYPILQREIAAHHVSSSVDAVLNLLRYAELGDLTAQSELFFDMEERDAHIYAEMVKRRMAVSQLDWTLAPARDAMQREKKQVADIEMMIRDSVDVETLVFDMTNGIGHGFACLEMPWMRDVGGRWMPKSIEHRPQRWFRLDDATRTEIRLRNNRSGDGDPLWPDGWIVHKHSAKTGNAATQGLFRVLALPYLFKNFAVKNWLRFCELYAIPMRVLLNNGTLDAEEKAKLVDALRGMGANGVAVLEGRLEDLKTVDAARGEGQGFAALIQWAEKSASKAILGGTLSSDIGDNGSRAAATVHDDVRYQIRDYDAKQIGQTLTVQLAGKIIRLNGLQARCRWQFDTQDPEDLALYADAIPKLVQVGFKIPSKWGHEKLKIPQPEGNEPVLGVQQAPQPPANQPPQAGLSAGHQCGVTLGADGKPRFTPQQQAIEDLGDDMLAHMAGPIDDAAIRSAIRGARDPEDLEARLAAVMRTANTKSFQAALEKALFAADVMGYAHADGR